MKLPFFTCYLRPFGPLTDHLAEPQRERTTLPMDKWN